MEVTSNHKTEADICYKGTISLEIFLRSQRLHAGSVRLSLFLVLVFIGLVFIGFAVAGGAPVAVFLAGVLAVVLVPLVLGLQRWQWRRLFKRSPYLREAIEGLVSEQGLRVQSSLGTGDFPWTLFTKYRETSDLILLYVAPNMFSIVAKELFGGEGDWQRTRGLIHERVKRG